MHKQQDERVIAENLALLYRDAATRYGDLPAFAIRKKALEWQPVSFKELYQQGLYLATALIGLGVKPREHVGLFSDNRYEWILTDYAVQFCGAADVPRGRDISDAELLYIIDHAGIKISFVETEVLALRLLKLKNKLPGLREIIILDPAAPAIEGTRRLADLYMEGRNVRNSGNRDAEQRIAAIRPDDLFTLIYTSGTTGTPKGVMLTHDNMMSQIRNLPGRHGPNDRILSVLPIWHVFERVIEMYTISFGGCTYYSSILTLSEDMKNVEPTFMASAPRLWEKVHEKILLGVRKSHPVRQILFHIAYFLATQYKNSEYFIANKKIKLKPQPIWKRVALMPFHVIRWLIVLPWYGFFNAAVLERVRLGAGGSLSATISGGGALPSHIDKFFNYVGIPVLEGYGLTETSPVVSVRSKLNLVVGTVGPPITETKVRISCLNSGKTLFPDASDAKGGRGKTGEIWVQGPQVMKGYYRDETLSRASIVDGWFRTGDLGMVTHNDCLKILGRSKATIVLSSGENVEPEPLEMKLRQSRYIDQCMVVGQDQKFLGLLIVPEPGAFRKNGFKPKTPAELAELPEVTSTIRKEIRQMISASAGFKRYEQIRDFRILPEAFVVGEELTNLYKIKRHVVTDKYQHVIQDIFANNTPKNK